MFELIVIGATALFFLFSAFILNAENAISKFYFKFLPFCFGIVNGLLFMDKMGWINLTT